MNTATCKNHNHERNLLLNLSSMIRREIDDNATRQYNTNNHMVIYGYNSELAAVG